MAMAGETLHLGAPSTCEDCNVTLKVKVHESGAGFYIGSWCNCGPYSRESKEYWPERGLAEFALAIDSWERR